MKLKEYTNLTPNPNFTQHLHLLSPSTKTPSLPNVYYIHNIYITVI